MATEYSDSQTARLEISWEEITARLAEQLLARFKPGVKPYRVYGVPKNGMILTAFLPKGFKAWHEASSANIILDDIIDSGATMERYCAAFTAKPFIGLYDKRCHYKNTWLVMPWENEQRDRESYITRILEMIGEDPAREGLQGTPGRVVRSWNHLYGGYTQDPNKYLKAIFTEKGIDEMVILKDIEFYSTCEHHMQPFFGKAHVGYVPVGGKVLGVSKIARVIECFSRRLQIQERLTRQIADFINQALKPLGVAVVMEAKHLCMMSRGIEKQNSVMTTSAMYGLYRENVAARTEFLNRIQ